jgi:hypothetical protein
LEHSNGLAVTVKLQQFAVKHAAAGAAVAVACCAAYSSSSSSSGNQYYSYASTGVAVAVAWQL